jgi:UDP-glucose 4-epimerase
LYAGVAEFFADKRVLITGGLGFLGSATARELVGLGSRVSIIDSLVPTHGGKRENVAGLEDELDVAIGDVRDPAILEPRVRECDVLLNLSGQTSHMDSMRDPITDLDLNCESQLAVVEACRKLNPECKLVFTSTRQLYGRPQYLPVDERHPVVPVDVNGIHKAAGEWYHLLYGEVYGLPTTVLRLVNTYGPRMRIVDARQTFLGYWVKLVLMGEELSVFGDGRQRRDLDYVDDAVAAILLAASRDGTDGEVYNLGGGRVVSLVELAELLIQANGGGSYRLVPFPDDQKPIDIGDYYADSSKFRGAQGWHPEVGLEEGLRRTLEFFRAQGPGAWGDPV